jgi:hypothetical protein
LRRRQRARLNPGIQATDAALDRNQGAPTLNVSASPTANDAPAVARVARLRL